MFSLLHKEEAAHDDGIWSCSWGRLQPEGVHTDNGEEGKDPDASNDSLFGTKKPEPVDFIVTGGLDDLVKVWDIREDDQLKLRHTLKGHSLGVVSVAVSPDGKTIASSSLDSSLCFWDSKSGQQKNLLSFGPVDLWTVAFSPCNKYVISGSNDGKISMYSVETGKAEQVLILKMESLP
ncbi:unnamed protein product [Ceratitis capitata]|uniref:(Mediterranean fruit fly) hypothetical protein n=1 Tax=Ceratitis capitata TaxID=7213 RepID=A0A811UAQ0_CERCA|nr:unnamed protein product [Ceratitis capitata]